jgi:hypothetical protein
MIGLPVQLPAVPALPRSIYVPLGAGIGAIMLALSLSPLMDGFVPRLLLFYAGTATAYGLMPFVRRGDIPLVAAWVVLLSELAPCIAGQLISPAKVAADALGVLLATAPIYLARLRQVQQGDTARGAARRSTDRA